MSRPGIPVAVVVAKEPNRSHPGAVVLAVKCPACGRTHWHGAPADDGPDHGHRAAHCPTGPDRARTGYYVRETA